MKVKKFFKYLVIFYIAIISVFIRIYSIGLKSGDFSYHLQNWFNTLKENGGIYALKMDLGDYNLPYVQILAVLTYLPFSPLYLVKIVSIIFDYLGAIFCGVLVYQVTKDKNLSVIGTLITIMLPTVILNSSAWAQCDFIYVTFIILSLLFLIRDKHIKSFIFLGIAFAFKLQTIFVLPVYILYYISERKFPMYYFLIIPIVDIILCLPSLIIGKPILDILKVYIEQTGEYNYYLSLNFPGIYNIFFEAINGTNNIEMTNQTAKWIGILSVGLIYFVFALVVFLKNVKFSNKKIIEFSVWSVMICTYFLPEMHDRYMFTADVISVVCALVDKKKWYVPVGVNITSLYTYIYYLFNKEFRNLRIVSIFLGITLILYTFSIFRELIEDNKLKKET